ncbi:hypothetical protein ESFECK385B1_09915 [Escherichia fergusonii]
MQAGLNNAVLKLFNGHLPCRPYFSVDLTSDWIYSAIRQHWPNYEQYLMACYERSRIYYLQLSLSLSDSEVIPMVKSIAKWIQKMNEQCFEFIVKNICTFETRFLSGKNSKGGRKSNPKSAGQVKSCKNKGLSRSTYYRRQRISNELY